MIKVKPITILLVIALLIVGVGSYRFFSSPKINITKESTNPQITPQESGRAPQSSQIANPASKNCIDKGGRLEIVKKTNGSEYGVCFFEDGRQCEEWAYVRGECPDGGLKVTGYLTDAAKYCAITGGKYTITDEKADPEKGTCEFINGKKCDVWDYYNGKCEKKIVGNDQDEHGCIGSAGYQWCEVKKKCVRMFEEDCSIPTGFVSPR